MKKCCKKQLEIFKKEKQVFNKLSKILTPTIQQYIRDNIYFQDLKSTYLHLYQMICSKVNGERLKPSIARDIILKANGDVKLTNQAYKIYVSMKGGK